jgi:hypothetical protein
MLLHELLKSRAVRAFEAFLPTPGRNYHWSRQTGISTNQHMILSSRQIVQHVHLIFRQVRQIRDPNYTVFQRMHRVFIAD